MNKTDKEYKQWLVDLKQRIRQSQIKAAVKINTELLRLYWDFGRDTTMKILYGAQGMPTCFFINQEGLVIMKEMGLDQERVNQLLKEQFIIK